MNTEKTVIAAEKKGRKKDATEMVDVKLTTAEKLDMGEALYGLDIHTRKIVAYANKESGIVVVKFAPRRNNRKIRTSNKFDSNMVQKSFSIISGKAKCCPDDTFNMETGLDLAKKRFISKVLFVLDRHVDNEIQEWKEQKDAIVRLSAAYAEPTVHI